ncbi:L-asparaginase-like isoform X1 [Amphibalanus amphitrite]|uniref:L-asparaginase-like isoform X1 n=1 Tax=Amphibalanus amphitrite TaxID=1232801 RepID=UPI001C906BA3|nr:L-asparaginase-like isoform X1 [Amphibalanus amphitrite]
MNRATFFLAEGDTIAEEVAARPVDASYLSKRLRRSSTLHSGLDLKQLATSHVGNERRVLVLYSGGTIGMEKTADSVLAPCPGVMENKLRTYPNMHDSEYAEQRFRRADTAALVLPLSSTSTTRVIYTVYEYDPLLDSSNMTMDDWIRIAKDIKQAYHWFDGFVILHGTDTMAYTASALSFMLENLGKTVIVTGSQIPIFETRSDGRDNFLVSLLLAGQFTIPEVSVFFNHELFRGNRTTKLSTDKLNAFGSPNLAPLASVGIDIEVDYKSLFRPTTIAKFEVHSRLCRNVGILRVFPSITTETVKAFLQEPIQGVVLQSYGAGNVPSNRKDLLEALREATQRGIIIVNCTQCSQGSVSTVYETGKSLQDAGVLPGADMTPEAALTKLAYVLTKDSWDHETKRKMVTQNLRGELSADAEVELQDQDLAAAVAQKLQMTSGSELERLRETLYPAMLCTAAETGDIQRVDTIRAFGADVSGTDYDRRTPLHVAASEGNLEMVRHLLHCGASVHVRDRAGATPLHCAVQFQRLDCIRCLVDGGAHLIMAPAQLGEHLCSAAAAGKLSGLEAYHLAQADLGQPDSTGRTALHVAALLGHSDICRMLLSYGVSVTAKDMLGFTPAAYARMAANFDLERLLEVPRGSPQLPRRDSPEDSADSAEGSSGLSSFLSKRFAGQLSRQLSRKTAESLRSLPTSAEAISPQQEARPDSQPGSRRSSRPASRASSGSESHRERRSETELAGSPPTQLNGDRAVENGVH